MNVFINTLFIYKLRFMNMNKAVIVIDIEKLVKQTKYLILNILFSV